jgi:hypothetical protein
MQEISLRVLLNTVGIVSRQAELDQRMLHLFSSSSYSNIGKSVTHNSECCCVLPSLQAMCRQVHACFWYQTPLCFANCSFAVVERHQLTFKASVGMQVSMTLHSPAVSRMHLLMLCVCCMINPMANTTVCLTLIQADCNPVLHCAYLPCSWLRDEVQYFSGKILPHTV